MTDWLPITEQELAKDMKSHNKVAIVEKDNDNLVRGSFDHYDYVLTEFIDALNCIEQYHDMIVNDKGQIINAAADVIIAIRNDDGGWSKVF